MSSSGTLSDIATTVYTQGGARAQDGDTGNVIRLPAPRRKGRGGSGTQLHGGWLTDDDPNADIRGSDWYGSPWKLGVAQRMLRDPHVMRSIEFISDPLCDAVWRFVPASKKPIDREVADFMNWAMLRRLAWRRYLRRMVKNYASAGFSIEEITDDLVEVPTDRFPNHKGNGLGIAPTGFHERPPRTITRWWQSKRDSSQLAGLEQSLAGSDTEAPGRVNIPSNRLLRITHDQSGAYYPGLALLRPTYQPWKLKIAFLAIDAIKHERTGVGVPTLTLPAEPQPGDIAAAETILAAMAAREKDFMILPDGYVFNWSGAGEANVSDIDQAIARCNLDIAWRVAAGFQHLGLTNKGQGSYAVGGTQVGAQHLFIAAHAALIEDAINVGFDGWSMRDRYVRLNYGPDVALPELRARNLPTRNWLEITKAVNGSVAAGTVIADDPLEEELRDVLGVGPHDPDTARDKPVSLGTQPKPDQPEPADEEAEDDPDLEDVDDEEPTEDDQ